MATNEEIEWWEYDDIDEMADAVAGDIAFIIESAIEARGGAVIALAGGKTPVPIYAKLAKAKLEWKRVTIIPGDERIVPLGDELSNVTMLAKTFLPLGARVMPIVPQATADYKAAGRSADALMQDLHWPLDLCLLGVGGDGHTASIFPGPDFDEALNGPKERRMLGVMPDPLPPEAPVARVTLSRAAIVSSASVMIAVTGAAKKKVIEDAIAQGPSSAYPIGRVLADTELPVDIQVAIHQSRGFALPVSRGCTCRATCCSSSSPTGRGWGRAKRVCAAPQDSPIVHQNRIDEASSLVDAYPPFIPPLQGGGFYLHPPRIRIFAPLPLPERRAGLGRREKRPTLPALANGLWP